MNVHVHHVVHEPIECTYIFFACTHVPIEYAFTSYPYTYMYMYIVPLYHNLISYPYIIISYPYLIP